MSQYRIVKHHYKDSDQFQHSRFYVQIRKSLLLFTYWSYITTLISYGSDVCSERLSFDDHSEAVHYVKRLDTPLPRDNYTYL